MSNSNDSSLKHIGQRIAELRATLSSDTGEKWSQPKLARELGLTQDIIYRLEQGSGSLDNFIKVLLFFHSKGFDLFWMIAPDNTSLPKYRQIKEQPLQENPEIIKALEKMSNLILGKSLS
jgi:hypothetical protein